jgi:hypothetical protein
MTADAVNRRWLWAALALTAFKLWLTSGQTVFAISSATMVLNRTSRGRSVEPVRVNRRRMMSAIWISALAPRWKAIETWRPSSARH